MPLTLGLTSNHQLCMYVSVHGLTLPLTPSLTQTPAVYLAAAKPDSAYLGCFIHIECEVDGLTDFIGLWGTLCTFTPRMRFWSNHQCTNLSAESTNLYSRSSPYPHPLHFSERTDSSICCGSAGQERLSQTADWSQSGLGHR